MLDRTTLLMLCADEATPRKLEQAGQHILGPVSDRLDLMPVLDGLVIKVVEPETLVLWETVLRLEALVAGSR